MPSLPPALSVNDLLFVNEYMRNGRNGKQAYLSVHPGVKANSAEVGAARLISKEKVQAELARRVRAEAGITKELVESTLLQALAWAHQLHDPLALASVGMDCARLGGFLIEKREVTTLTDEQSSAIRALVRRTFPTTGSSSDGARPSSDVMLNAPTPAPSGPSSPDPVNGVNMTRSRADAPTADGTSAN